MTTDVYLQLALDTANTGKKVDCGPGPLTDSAGNLLYRQVGLIGDPTNVAAVASVKAAAVSPSFAADGAAAVSLRDIAPVALVATAALASSLVLKASPGALYSLTCAPTLNGWLMLFDLTAAPADGAVAPKWTLPVSGATGGQWNWDVPLQFLNGIVAVYSSTGPFVKTASATAFISGQPQ